MKVESKTSKEFQSVGLTHTKRGVLNAHADYLLEQKNFLSEYIFTHVEWFLSFKNVYEFIKACRLLFKGKIPSSFDKQLYEDVYNAYENKINRFIKNSKSQVQKSWKPKYYKQDDLKHGKFKKGDLKSIEVKHKSTVLCKTVDYLVRYGNEGTIEYINRQLNENEKLSESKREFYTSILKHITKFDVELEHRLTKLALSRRARAIAKSFKHKIVFKSKTFRGRIRTKNFLYMNTKSPNSCIHAYITFGNIIVFDDNGEPLRDENGDIVVRDVVVPVKYAPSYHGRLSDINLKKNNHEYTCKFNKCGFPIIVKAHKCEREVVEVSPTDIIRGCDVNQKHNLLMFSDGFDITYDKDLVNSYIKELKKIDALKKQNKDYVVGKKKQKKLDAIHCAVVSDLKNKVADGCKYLQSIGCHHNVMEDLDNNFGRCFATSKTTEEEINCNRLNSILHLGELKNWFKTIGVKYGVAVSLVPSEYSSQQCSECMSIDKDNRKVQEEFKCIYCDHSANADVDAAKILEIRVAETVFSQKLLDKQDDGTYIVKKSLNTHDKRCQAIIKAS